MIDDSAARQTLRDFITVHLMQDADYPLADDEPLFSEGLIDPAAMEELSLFIEEQFGLHIDAADLSTENIDTLDAILFLLKTGLE